jgi:hypothetical protein
MPEIRGFTLHRWLNWNLNPVKLVGRSWFGGSKTKKIIDYKYALELNGKF